MLVAAPIHKPNNSPSKSTQMVPNHEITIKNFKSGEIVYHSVLIIKGLITNKACQNFQEKIYFSSDLFFKVTDSKFKAVIELKPGQNNLTLKYCCTITNFSLYFNQRDTQFSVLPLYIVCDGHDGCFQAPTCEKNDAENACQRITLGTKLLQSVIAEKMFEDNRTRKTFQLEDNCRVFQSRLHFLEARKMSQEELWSRIGREIIDADLEHERIKFLGFLSCTKYSGEHYEPDFTHEDVINNTQAYVALGGGGLALFGTACLYTWPETISQIIEKFLDCTLIDPRNFMDDSCYRSTLGACFSTTLGSVLHELCHTFDLGHTELGIMGRGFDDIYKVFMNTNKEVIDRMHRQSIEFGEELEPKLLSERLVEPKKSFSVKNGSRKNEEDCTFWTKSCLVFLSYHKWLNNFDKAQNKIIKFDSLTKLVTSTAGLRVIEIRCEKNGMVLLNWIFDGRILKYSFQLPEDDLAQLKHSVIMFVEDNIGNILKQII